jgi:short-subunit dehydrogenase
VAGQRGRKKNYHYGSAKAGFSVYLSGLRNRLAPHRIAVLTVLPGYVQTKMTRGLSLPPALTAAPDQAARDIYRAYTTGKSIIFTNWCWRWIMLIIQHIPESLFKRMNI